MQRTYDEVKSFGLHITCSQMLTCMISVTLVPVFVCNLSLLYSTTIMLQARSFIEQQDATKYKVKEGFVPNMRVPGYFYVNDRLKELIFEELQHSCQRGSHGGFLPAVQQLANVAGLPGIVKV